MFTWIGPIKLQIGYYMDEDHRKAEEEGARSYLPETMSESSDST